MATIAILGTGLLGSGFVQGACARGDEVRVWNRTIQKARALESVGAVVCERAADAVRGVSRVHLVVSDDAAVEAVLADVLPAIASDTVIVDHTTTSPQGTAERSQRLAARGVAYLHAPVFMGPEQARTAKGMMLASGPEAVFHRVEHELKRMTTEVWYFGERPDKAAAFKLFGNAMIITIAAGIADVLTIAKGVGIEAHEAIGLFSKFKVAGAIDVRGARMARGDFAASFEMVMARKDVRLMLEAATDAPFAALPSIAKRMDALIAAGHGQQDLGVLGVDAISSAAK
jgi:3-hydroxyisobutyrate dehydrogenase-like beta-hydroxyacid dehydrogenase